MHASAYELRASCASTGISQVANRCVAIRCTFLEVHTMSGYRFRVVLCDYERYIMSLYMYYRVVVVVDTLNYARVSESSRPNLWL